MDNTIDEPSPDWPYGYGMCHCGCGQRTTIADRNHTRGNVVKGVPRRFLLGHYARIQHSPLSFEERFWSKVDRSGGPDVCWPWIRALQPTTGYGAVGTGPSSHTPALAHRVAWELTNGPIPGGLCVLHHCDNRRCCNPSHLFLGTRTDNALDKVAKERQTRGEQVRSAKFTADDIRSIRARVATGELRANLAHEYDVTWSCIQSIVLRKTWRHI